MSQKTRRRQVRNLIAEAHIHGPLPPVNAVALALQKLPSGISQ